MATQYGTNGNDVIDGTTGNDTLYGLDGDDIISGYAGNDILKGGDGNDTLKGGNGDDTLYGGAGNDTLFGGLGNDYLSGGAGDDIMRGHGGDDTYVVDSANDMVYETLDAGTDRVNAYVDYTLGANVENLYLYDTAVKGIGNSLDNVIVGNGNANTLYGLDGNDTLRGGNGDDTLKGYADNDILYGGAGRDFLYGGNGNDTLYGEKGNDYLNGGAGQDRFVFSHKGEANADKIADFSHDASDKIVLKDILDGVTDGSIEGLEFDGTVLDDDCYFEGNGFTGNGAEDSGIYYDTANGDVWYNPTTGEGGDSVKICTLIGVPGAIATLLDSADITYSA